MRHRLISTFRLLQSTLILLYQRLKWLREVVRVLLGVHDLHSLLLDFLEQQLAIWPIFIHDSRMLRRLLPVSLEDVRVDVRQFIGIGHQFPVN